MLGKQGEAVCTRVQQDSKVDIARSLRSFPTPLGGLSKREMKSKRASLL